MDKENSSGRINRRSVLKNAATVTSLLGATGISGIGLAGAKRGDDEVEVERNSSVVGAETVETLVETTIANRLLAAVGNPDYDATQARRIDVYLDDQYFAHVFEITTAVGSLTLGYEASRLRHGELSVERDELSKRTRKHVSKHIDWPEETNGVLTLAEGQESILFARGVTDEERGELSTFVGEEQIASAVGYQKPGTNEAHYVVVTETSRYTVKRNLNKVESTDPLDGPSGGSDVGIQASCQEKASLCFIDIMMAYPHCATGAVACTITGPMTAACAAAVLAFCAPNVALVYLSGNCSYIANNCL